MCAYCFIIRMFTKKKKKIKKIDCCRKETSPVNHSTGDKGDLRLIKTNTNILLHGDSGFHCT